MLIFYWGGGGGGPVLRGRRYNGGQWTTVVSVFLPLLIQFLIPFLFGRRGFSDIAYVYDDRFGWRRIHDENVNEPRDSRPIDLYNEIWEVLSALMMMVGILIGFFVLVFLVLRRRRREPIWETLRREFGGRARPGRSPRYRQRREKLNAVIQSLPVEKFQTRDELNKLSVRDLKDLISNHYQHKDELQKKVNQCLEKSELVEALLEGQNSTNESCSICLEQYQSGDSLRILPCKHQFHVDCVDRWLYSSIDYSRPSACPVCNAVVVEN